MTGTPKRIYAWPHFDGWITGDWSANTYYDERAVAYILAAEHDRMMAEKDAEIARLRAALLSGKAFAEDWIAEHGGIDGCDYSDRLAFENMCAALGDSDE